MRTRKHQYSFAGGAISPEFFGRGDAVQYQTGLAQARNQIIKPQGSARSRPGTEFANRCFNQASKSQLMPFNYDLDQAYAIEVGNGVFRFHSGGSTLLWASPVNVGELGTTTTLDLVSDPNGILICEEPHGLTSGDEVRATVTAGGTLVGGLASFQDFKVTVVDSRRLQFSTSAGYPTLITIGPGLGSGYMRMFRTGELPRTYVEAENFVPGDVNTGTETITIAGHLFQDNDEVRVGGTPPSPLAINTSYFVVGSVAGVSVQLSETLGGPVINLSSTGAGTMTLSYRYKQGDLTFVPVNGGLFDAGTVLYCERDNDSDLLYPNTAGDWYAQLSDGIYTVPTPYNNLEVFDLNWDQSGDVVTIVHPNHPEMELRRSGNLSWVLTEVPFVPGIASATGVTVVENYGEQLIADTYEATTPPSSTPMLLGFGESQPGVAVGTPLLCTASAGGPGLTVGATYIVNNIATTAPPYKLGIRTLAGATVLTTSVLTNTVVNFAFTDLIADTNQYKVASVDVNGIENLSATTGGITNNLSNPGASNDISWTAAEGAVKYKVYKKQTGTGVFGLVGETEQLTFTDSGISPDLTLSAPVADSDIGNAANYSRATARFEQSRCFGGSDLFPRRLFISRKGTETDFTSRTPPVDDDRIAIEVAAREAHVIRHIVPLGDLVLLTQLGEWRVFAVNSDAITPTTVAVRPQSYVGSSAVRPLVVNNSLLYCAARGGHVRELGFRAAQRGFVTGDLSLRAAHLFDGKEIVSAAYQKAPVPVGWFVSDDGKLLGITYVPEERIGGWHHHDTGAPNPDIPDVHPLDGAFEAVCVIPDGGEDRVYVTVRRWVGGAYVRNVERLGTIAYKNVFDSPGLDAHLRFSGDGGSSTLTITGGAGVGDAVTVDSSATTTFSKFDVGKRLSISSDGIVVEITEFVNQTRVNGVMKSNMDVTKRGVALSTWAFAVKTIAGLGTLEGKEVSIVRTNTPDLKATVETATVTNGAITLSEWTTLADVGLRYDCDLQLPPITLQLDALGYGRGKAINHAWIRVFESAGLQVGADVNDFTDIPSLKSPGGLVTEESRALLGGNRSQDGMLTVRQSLPLPATIVSATIEVSVAE